MGEFVAGPFQRRWLREFHATIGMSSAVCPDRYAGTSTPLMLLATARADRRGLHVAGDENVSAADMRIVVDAVEETAPREQNAAVAAQHVRAHTPLRALPRALGRQTSRTSW